MRGPALKDVRLEGWLGAKMDRFISRRLVDSFMREQIFDEARQAGKARPAPAHQRHAQVCRRDIVQALTVRRMGGKLSDRKGN